MTFIDRSARYGPHILAIAAVILAGIALYQQQFLMVILFLLAFLVCSTLNQLLNNTFQQGWTGCAAAYDDVLAQRRPDLDQNERFNWLLAVTHHPPNRRAYNQRLRGLIQEIAAIPPEQVTEEELRRVAQKYRPGSWS